MGRRRGSSSPSSCAWDLSRLTTARNRGRVYHVRHRAVYEAIGEPESRLRRPPGVPRALERLVLLDAILENPESVWMSSRAEKMDYFSRRGIATDDYPHRTVRQGDQLLVRHFPDRLPVGVHPSGHVVFVYLNPTRCATSSATSSSVTRRCSRRYPPGRSESWFRRTWRVRYRTGRRPRGGNSPRR